MSDFIKEIKVDVTQDLEEKMNSVLEGFIKSKIVIAMQQNEQHFDISFSKLIYEFRKAGIPSIKLGRGNGPINEDLALWAFKSHASPGTQYDTARYFISQIANVVILQDSTNISEWLLEMHRYFVSRQFYHRRESILDTHGIDSVNSIIKYWSENVPLTSINYDVPIPWVTFFEKSGLILHQTEFLEGYVIDFKRGDVVKRYMSVLTDYAKFEFQGYLQAGHQTIRISWK